jgi:hypothetical protein
MVVRLRRVRCQSALKVCAPKFNIVHDAVSLTLLFKAPYSRIEVEYVYGSNQVDGNAPRLISVLRLPQ